MRILRRAFERLEFDIGRLGDQGLPQFLPTLAELMLATGKHVVGKFRRAEADEPGNRFLLGRRCRPLLSIEQVQQPDRLDIVACAFLP